MPVRFLNQRKDAGKSSEIGMQNGSTVPNNGL